MRGAIDHSSDHLTDWMAGGYWLHIRVDRMAGTVSSAEAGAFVDGPELPGPVASVPSRVSRSRFFRRQEISVDMNSAHGQTGTPGGGGASTARRPPAGAGLTYLRDCASLAPVMSSGPDNSRGQGVPPIVTVPALCREPAGSRRSAARHPG